MSSIAYRRAYFSIEEPDGLLLSVEGPGGIIWAIKGHTELLQPIKRT